jgi:glycosyltransferase involved in cell wall biosynthesis
MLKNINNLLHASIADAGLSPTHWQASTYPEELKKKISVIHDGINTQEVKPAEAVVRIKLADQELELTRKDKVVTYVSRNLEPYRGFHSFMRAIPEMLAAEPDLRVIIVGSEGVSYGVPPDQVKYGSSSWKEIFLSELRSKIKKEDEARVIFLGKVSYPEYLAILQISSVHVYLTYPFVLSWSLLEAMSAGCTIVASNTSPLREVIEDEKTGCLVDFFDYSGIALKVIELIQNPQKREYLSSSARKFVIENYDLQSVCLPRQIKWVESLAPAALS